MRLLLALAAALLSFSAARPADAQSDGFLNCGTQTFADCTTAICDPRTYQCVCNVVSGVVSGVDKGHGCIAPTNRSPTGSGTAQSRYSPVKETGLCAGPDRPWAQCLGVVCQVSLDGKIAACPCSKTDAQQSGGGPYVIVTQSAYQGQCSDGVTYSSATYLGDVMPISQALGFPLPKVIWNR